MQIWRLAMSEYLIENENIQNDEILFENDEELLDLEFSSEDEKPLFESIRVTKKDFSVFELYRKYQKKQLVLEVDFQRKNVWSPKQKCELIESILMGLPLPIFYFKQQNNATYVVVDGKQRLSTLFEFLDNGFKLKSLKILSFLNGKKFDDLTNEYAIYQSQLEDYQVYSHVILPPTPDRILFDIFDRVNRGGTQLNKQEIRNALYQGKGLDAITEITKTKEFVYATRISYEKDPRMKGSYLVTRFLSFYLLLNRMLMKDGVIYEYNGDSDDLIEATLTQLNKTSNEELRSLIELTTNALRMSYDLFGRGAFRRELNESKPINMNIFETTLYLMVLLSKNNIEISKERIKKEFYSIITSDMFYECIGNSRDNYMKVYTRFKMMENLYEVVCND